MNTKIKIISDSGSDFLEGFVSENNIDIIPFGIFFGDQEFRVSTEESKREFFRMMERTGIFPTTSQPSPHEYIKHFQKAKEENIDLLVITISSKLSGSYNTAQMAKEYVDYEKIHILNSRSASVGQALVVEKAISLKNQFLPIEEILAELETYIDHILMYGIVSDLEYLHKGGRLSKGAKIIGSMMNIKPILQMDKTGVITIKTKAVSLHNANQKLIKLLKEEKCIADSKIYLFTGLASEEYDKFRLTLEKSLGMEIEYRQLGAAIGAYLGPLSYVVAFVKKFV